MDVLVEVPLMFAYQQMIHMCLKCGYTHFQKDMNRYHIFMPTNDNILQ